MVQAETFPGIFHGTELEDNLYHVFFSGVSCERPVKPLHSSMQGDNFTLGHSVAFTCQSGYSVLGRSRITCLSSQLWSHTPPTCMPINCSALPNFAHGTPNTTDVSYRVVVGLLCKLGYEAVGIETTECLSNANWSTPLPRCTLVSCPVLAAPRYVYVVKTNASYGGRMVWQCMAGFTAVGGDAVRTCRHDKQWSGTDLRCQGKRQYDAVFILLLFM